MTTVLFAAHFGFTEVCINHITQYSEYNLQWEMENYLIFFSCLLPGLNLPQSSRELVWTRISPNPEGTEWQNRDESTLYQQCCPCSRLRVSFTFATLLCSCCCCPPLWHYRSQSKGEKQEHIHFFLIFVYFLMNRASTSVYFWKMFRCKITIINSCHFLHPFAIPSEHILR